MNNAEKRLVEALRSGKYPQTTGVLRRGNGFCCLGVACDVFDSNRWRSEFVTYDDLQIENYSFLCQRINLPFSVKRELEWVDSEGLLIFSDRNDNSLYLSSLNDDGFTFNQIADVIEADLVERYDYDNEV